MALQLVGACFQQAFLANFSGRPPAAEELSALACRLAATVLEPTGSTGGG
jgi:hypothetical protein